MKTNRFLSLALLAVLFFTANASAVDLGKFTKKAGEAAKKASADLEQIAKKLEKLQSDKINVSEDERGVVLTFSSQLFAVGKADLTDEAKENLLEASKTLAEYPDANVEIEGHTDSTGSAKLNQDLSERRAKNVMLFLIELGIAKERLSAVGYGKDRPIADNKTEAGRATNRRVELIVKMESKEEEVKEEKIQEEKERIRFGIRGGLALVGISGSDDFVGVDNSKDGLGIGLGGFISIPISSFYFVPELFIHYRNLGEFSYTVWGSTTTFIYEEIGIDIPLMLRFPLGENRKFYLEAGPQIGFVIATVNTPEEREAFEYGLTLGAGYKTTDNWGIDLRGYYSFARFYDYTTNRSIDGSIYYVQIGVSYTF